jgi:predicted dehydrogenase
MNEHDSLDYNRRDFLKGGSVAALMTMLGGVELFANADATPPTPAATGPKLKIAVIGLGAWGREIISTLAVVPELEVVAICDNYPAFLRRAAKDAPGATQTEDYKTILANPDVKAVVVATPTHKHKEIVLAALAAGKHVYCEAPLANSIEDAKAIALAARDAKRVMFQAGFQMRSDPQRKFLMPFIRSGALGNFLQARAQYHKKTSWRTTSPNPAREKELNWRLDQATSLGLIGEIGSHQIDQAAWLMNTMPKAITGFGSIAFYKEDGRDVPDTIQAVLEFTNGARMIYDATLANSFDASYEMIYGSGAAVMLRGSKAWMFQESDAILGGWEVYASKERILDETGIILKAGASKSAPPNTTPTAIELIQSTPLFFALQNFARNASDLTAAEAAFKAAYGEDDKEGLLEQLGTIYKQRRSSAGYLEGYQATVTAIKANEAIVQGRRVELKPEWYELS